MADNVSKSKRSEIMSAIKGKDSVMEKRIRKELSRIGLKYKKNVSGLPGKPDIVFSTKKIAIFLDSCFWHGCSRHCRLPEAHRYYWRTKITRNRKRDKEINEIYKNKGWRILRFWEHELNKNSRTVTNKIEKLLDLAGNISS